MPPSHSLHCCLCSSFHLGFLSSEPNGGLSSEAEGWIEVGQQSHVGLYPQRIAEGLYQVGPDSLRVLASEEHGEEATEDSEARNDEQAGQHEVVGNGEEPLVERFPPSEVLGIGQAEGCVRLGPVVLGGEFEVEWG